jgi:hypothetical protein
MKLLNILLIVAILTGCIAFRKNDLKNYDTILEVAETVSKKATYKLEINAYQSENGSAPVLQTNAQTNPQERISQYNTIFGEIGLLVLGDLEKVDFSINIKLTDYRRGAPLLDLLFIFTSLLIPTYANHDIHLVLEIKNKDGKVLGVVEKKESYTTISELALLLAAPFNRPNERIKNVYRDLLKASLEEAIQKKYFGNFTPRAKVE